ncbi:MAG: 3-phosphoshikimate 1-carboxyvinyltransferase, partial [Sphingomonas bacterium]|nr:3-phosphoshikimate 1-carboxyvinyltransferase [Sphingomonas bacterium]
IAMSFAVAGLIARDPITIDDIAPVATSFPGFQGMLAQLTEWAGPPEAAAAS